MFEIDNRLLLPAAIPVALTLVARLVFFVAGAEWNGEVALFGAAVISVIGIYFGCIVTKVLFELGITIGKIRIGRNRRNGDGA